ncbi:hypothetical protein [Mycoplasmopsis felis]|uniref:hypothetical protein n=1 Tax=Mycoplasmopsis felis TaxID=33923 RepID=UPI003A4D65FA
MNKKKLLIATGLLTGTVIGVGVGVGIALSSSKNTGNSEEAKKNYLKKFKQVKVLKMNLVHFNIQPLKVNIYH